jgi:type I restriction enzyme S subunit
MKKIVKLKEIASYSKGSQVNGVELLEDGEYDYLNGGINPSGKWNEYNVSANTIAISEGGNSCGYVNYMNTPFWCGAHCYYLFETIDNTRYLYYALKSQQKRIMQLRSGACMPNIKKSDLGDFEFMFECDEEEQSRIVNILGKVENIISYRNKQLLYLDELVKARFVEMFGDPVVNPHGYEKVALSELAEIKIGPFGSLLHKEDYIENGHPILNPSHITEGKIVPDYTLTISDEKYKELSPYQLRLGDVVMGRRGEMGRCAVVMEEGFLCGTGSLIIRTKGKVTSDYIQKIISFPSFKKSVEDMAVGQTMPNLNVPIVSSFQIIKPPIEVQNNYYLFVAEVDKSKVAIQSSLDQTQQLFDSLMQEYFG